MDYSSSSCSSSSLSSDEEVDVRDLKPIKEYLANRRELARQLFKSVKPQKIRMMLPQLLKKVDLGELEEWCASELSGMSKARILAILNSRPMLESSDSSETDDSGPSLEIISETEAWLTDDETNMEVDKKSEVLSKTKIKKEKLTNKGRKRIDRKNDLDKVKLKSKHASKDGSNVKHRDVHVKQEGEKEVVKEKEGDSLLDLLELEMRARAIRALIRNEEDIIPNSSKSRIMPNNCVIKDKTEQDELKAKENCRKQLEQIITSKHGSVGDDDVMLVVQPTPTIELLSSESEEDGHGTRINKKLENERTQSQNISRADNNSNDSDNLSRASNLQVNTDQSDIMSGVVNNEGNCYNACTSSTIAQSTPSVNQSTCSEKQWKLQRKIHIKEVSKGDNESCPVTTGAIKTQTTQEPRNKEPTETDMASSVEKKKVDTCQNISTELKKMQDTEIIKEPHTMMSQNVTTKVVLEEDRSAELEEIIDLDDYSDDMNELDADDRTSRQMNVTNQSNAKVSNVDVPLTKAPVHSAETWATRYYQTDDVQSVIKESKIQSEIRKRLRERQRLSKLNKSPNLTSSTSPILNVAINDSEEKPTGSVQEYLALKHGVSTNIPTVTNNSNMNTGQGKDSLDETHSNSKIEDVQPKESIISDSTSALDVTHNASACTSVESFPVMCQVNVGSDINTDIHPT